MATNKYQTPIVEIVNYALIHTLMVSEPTPATDGGPDLAPRRKVF